MSPSLLEVTALIYSKVQTDSDVFPFRFVLRNYHRNFRWCARHRLHFGHVNNVVRVPGCSPKIHVQVEQD